LVAGLLTLGAGPAQAQDETVLIECDRVAGTGKVKPPLSAVAVPDTAASVKGPNVGGTDPFKPLATTRDCTGILATPGDGGNPDDVGPLTKVSGKLIGSATCNLIAEPPITDPLDPLDGKLTMTFTTLDAKLKPWSSAGYVRIGGSDDPLLPDALVISNGIVTKGAGVGADVQGSFIFAPYSKAKPIVPDQSFIDGNSILVAGAGSQAIGLNCIAGLGVIDTIFWGTDGTGLLGGNLNSSIKITLPAPAEDALPSIPFSPLSFMSIGWLILPTT
jgi:hypothetical protein